MKKIMLFFMILILCGCGILGEETHKKYKTACMGESDIKITYPGLKYIYSDYAFEYNEITNQEDLNLEVLTILYFETEEIAKKWFDTQLINYYKDNIDLKDQHGSNISVTQKYTGETAYKLYQQISQDENFSCQTYKWSSSKKDYDYGI